MNHATSKGGLHLEAINPRSLSNEDLRSIQEVTQDMWASEGGLWEFVQCRSCRKMHSKREVFWHLSHELYNKTVAQIMKILGIEEIPCMQCEGDTKFLYGPDIVRNIQERLTNSADSFALLCRNHVGEVIGYMDGYIDSPKTIYERELAAHYHSVGFEEIRSRVERVLGYSPELMLCFSSIGLLEQHVSILTFFRMLETFAALIPKDALLIPGITELDKNNNTYTIHQALGCHSLKIGDDPQLRVKIQNTGDSYTSDIVAYHAPIRQFREKFLGGAKQFLRENRIARPREVVSEVLQEASIA